MGRGTVEDKSYGGMQGERSGVRCTLHTGTTLYIFREGTRTGVVSSVHPGYAANIGQRGAAADTAGWRVPVNTMERTRKGGDASRNDFSRISILCG